MALLSILGRLLFVSIFIFSACREFNDVDWTTVIWTLKWHRFKLRFFYIFGDLEPPLTENLIYLTISTPILYNFYSVDVESIVFTISLFKFMKNLALIGALIFYIGMKNSMYSKKAAFRRRQFEVEWAQFEEELHRYNCY